MIYVFFFFQAEDGIRDVAVTGVQTCALPIYCDANPDPYTSDGRAAAGTTRPGRSGNPRDCRKNHRGRAQEPGCRAFRLCEEIRSHGLAKNRSLDHPEGNPSRSKSNQRWVSEGNREGCRKCSNRGGKTASATLDRRDFAWSEDPPGGQAHRGHRLLHSGRPVFACLDTADDRCPGERCGRAECGRCLPRAESQVASGSGNVRRRANRTHRDRKSTRLNSSHGYISYAVFCLKKKNKDLAS